MNHIKMVSKKENKGPGLMDKINRARKLEKKLKHYPQNAVSDKFHTMLKEITDKSELLFSDVKVKRYRFRESSKRLNELEEQLDNILLQAANLKKIIKTKN